ncbi:MAG: PIN domain-containing protein [Nitrospinae bacterium]|nr:PIN domain-containing protein [Nitrospinota bacterium]
MRQPRSAAAQGKRREPKRYVLDTSAVIAYLANEAGAQEVTALLRRAERGQVELLLSFMSLMELEYNAMRRGGRELATDVLMKVRALPLTLSFTNDPPFLHEAALLKASYPLSVADALIAALARTARATLLHKDPEFEALTGVIASLPLPYKSPTVRPSP